ncbi:MAG: SusD/RagB family nutrient-binding outer membrane lipoprotein [Bacteroidota bacterium]
MKKTLIKILYAAGTVLMVSIIASCDTEALTDLNKNPDVIETAIPDYSFTAAVLNSYPPDNYRALAQGLQYFSSYKEVPAVGDKFTSFNNMTGSFDVYKGNNDGSGTSLNRLVQLKERIPGPENVNKRAAIDILSVFLFHRATDQMGDLPYSEAMKGIGTSTPKYDTQKSIYTGMLTMLETALTSMDASKPNVFGAADPYYKGDVVKWKKLGFTLMARLGMRLSEIEPATAKTWVEKASTGGMMTAFADIAYVKFANTAGQFNPRVNGYITGDFTSPGDDNVEGSKWSKTFIDHLKTTNDPRLSVISVVWVKPAGSSVYSPDNTPALQRGMLNGSLRSKPADFDSYSEPSLLYIDRGSPIITMGPAEAYLILAEAAARGWSVGTTAKAAYDNGVRAAMAQWALWPSIAPHNPVITTAQADAYLAANPYTGGTITQQVQQISTQKWVSLLGDDYEVWSNWRRTKFPVFNYANFVNTNGTLSSFPGNVTLGKMFRRMALPFAENSVNTTNYQDAVKRQNFTDNTTDLLQGRVWWDVGPGTGQSNTN